MGYTLISTARMSQLGRKDARYITARYTSSMKLQIWAKGRAVPGHDPRVWRIDAMGGVMQYDKYGDRGSQFGWEVDHIIPRAGGGGNNLENLQPLYWRNNASKGSKI